MSPLPLLPMRPVFLEKIWGGDRIAALPGKGAPTGKKVGESWEVADLPEGQSVVASGPLEGRTLRSLTVEHGAALTGGPQAFPLLVKLIDAAQDLSVQVHPGREEAARRPGTFSKDESWLVVEAAPGACVFHGFVEGTDRPGFEEALQAGRVTDVLRRVPVAPGDVLRVAPGTVHAILGGVVVLEVQEPSDTTFRVHDYGRLENGAPRKLHLHEAMEVLRFGPQPRAKEPAEPVSVRPEVDVVVRSPAYEMRRARLAAGEAWSVQTASSPLVVFGLAGVVTIEHATGDVVLQRGHTVVVPASAGSVRLRAQGPCTAMIMSVPTSI